MNWHFRPAVVALILTAVMALAALPGCGVAKVKVTGKLMKNGQPLKVSHDTYVTLVFSPDAEVKNQTYPAKFNHQTGGYELELPAGPYRTSYIIVEKGQPPVTAPPEVTSKSYDLSQNQELDIVIVAK